jgi:hypothetical protein
MMSLVWMIEIAPVFRRFAGIFSRGWLVLSNRGDGKAASGQDIFTECGQTAH